MTVMVVVLLVMGPAKIPDVAKTLGKGVRAARRASNELKRAMDMDTYEAPIRSWERDLAVSDADVYEDEASKESADDLHHPDGTLKESAPTIPGTIARLDPTDELLATLDAAEEEAQLSDSGAAPVVDDPVVTPPVDASNDS